jgi:hypothetical protein
VDKADKQQETFILFFLCFFILFFKPSLIGPCLARHMYLCLSTPPHIVTSARGVSWSGVGGKNGKQRELPF